MEKGLSRLDYYRSPLGLLKITASDSHLIGVEFEMGRRAKRRPNHITDAAQVQLNEYFHKKRKVFDVPIDLGDDGFRKKVLELVTAIPYGEYRSYGLLAKNCGGKRYSRAVGSAIGKNPIAIVVPCHRVIGHNMNLVGYSGGIANKRRLLEMEGVLKQLEFQFTDR